MSLLLLRRPTIAATGTLLGLGTFTLTQTLLQPRASLLRCDAPPSSSFSATARNELRDHQSNARTPIVKSGRLNPAAVRQISAGSIAGLLGGLALSVFSKPLAVILGLLVIGVQVLESRGLHIIPYARLQSLFRNTDVVSAVRDNVAFKLCFGTTFALAAFADFTD